MTNDTATLNTLAEEVLAETGWDFDAAERLILARATEEMFAPSKHLAVRSAMNTCATNKRHEMRNGGGHVSGDTPMTAAPASPLYDPQAGLKALAERNYESMFDFPLHGGLLLGDATIGELTIAIERRRKNALTQFLDARWFALIIKRLPDDTTRVRDVVGEQELADLQKDAVSDD